MRASYPNPSRWPNNTSNGYIFRKCRFLGHRGVSLGVHSAHSGWSGCGATGCSVADMSSTPTIPAGWYPDPSGSPHSRWWDGAQWTDHVQQPYDPNAAAIALTAPAGTKVYTPWIWLIVFVPYVSLPLLFSPSFTGMFQGLDITNPSAASGVELQLMTSPAYIVSVLAGWLVYGLCVLFAYLDFKTLGQRGVPRPFHWAWTFLYSPVYVIGRSVVVRRRTGTGIAPMWAAIAMAVVSVIVSFVAVGMMMAPLLQQIANYSR